LIISKGSIASHLSFVVNGEVGVYINNPNLGKIVGEYFIKNEGNMIGEIGVAFKTTRTANVIALNYLILS
jgi:CRP-like cAMP-binding protein